MIVTDAIDIAASPEGVWEVTRDVERWSEWTVVDENRGLRERCERDLKRGARP